MKKRKKAYKILVIAAVFLASVLATASLSSFTYPDIDAENDTSVSEYNGEDTADSINNESDEGYLSILFSELEDNSDKILSALSFVASLVLMYFYKRGLIPTVEGTVRSIAQSVRSVSDATATLTTDSEKLTSSITDRLDGTERMLTLIGDSLSSLSEKLNDKEENMNEQKAFRTVLMTEIDLLYEIFMSAELPHYLKENVGEKISKMKADLEEIKK